MVEHKDIFKEFILDDQDSDRELTIEERDNILSKKIEAIKESSTWTGDLELSGISIMLNININIYIKSVFAYKRYWKFLKKKLILYMLMLIIIIYYIK